MAQEDYYEKVQALRREQPHVSSKPKTAKPKTPPATFQVRSVDPNKGFALIDTDREYGVAGADLSTRKIQVGDELPEGSVTGFTSEGIVVIPPSDDELAPVSDEFVIPFGKRTGFTPKVNPKLTYDASVLTENPRIASFLDTLTNQSELHEEGIAGSAAAVTMPDNIRKAVAEKAAAESLGITDFDVTELSKRAAAYHKRHEVDLPERDYIEGDYTEDDE